MERIKINKNIKYNKILSSSIIFLAIITLLVYVSDLYNSLGNDIPQQDLILEYVKSFTIFFNLICIISGILCYISSKKDELFFMSLIYTIFIINIMYINELVEFKDIVISYNNVGISILIIFLFTNVIIENNNIRKVMVNNKIKSTCIISVITMILLYIQYCTNIDIYFKDNNLDMIFSIIKFLMYFLMGCILLRRCFIRANYIDGIIGFTSIVYSMKISLYILRSLYSIEQLNLMSLFLNYITFMMFVIGVFVEFTQNIYINKQLNDKNNLFFKIFQENKHSCVLVSDMNYNIIYANNKFYDNKHFNSGNKPNNLNELYKHKDTNNIEEELFRENYFNKILELEDKHKFIDLTVQIFKDNNKEYMIIEFRDISEKYKIQKALTKIENMKKEENMKSEFFANISHELKTPLNIIYSTFQLLNLKLDKDEFIDLYIKYKPSIDINCKRMLRLIDNVVDMTKLDVGHKVPEFRNCDIIKLVEDITMSVVDFAKYKNINVIFDTDIEELVIKLDVDMVERIILNLLSNAIKFTDSGGEIFVKIHSNEEMVRISVIDDGIGISKDIQESIFERFYQGDKSLSRKKEGSGIGLSLVKSVVELLGGDIYVNSDGISGSEFIVELKNELYNEDEITFNNYEVDNQKIKLEFSDIYEIYDYSLSTSI